MFEAVLDTCVLTAAMRSRSGASFALLDAVRQRRIVPCMTTSLYLEYESVLTRPEHLAASAASRQDVERIIGLVALASRRVRIHMSWRPQLPDADDEFVLEAAINGRADMLITHNVRDFEKSASRFGIEVVRPSEVLRRL